MYEITRVTARVTPSRRVYSYEYLYDFPVLYVTRTLYVLYVGNTQHMFGC